MLYIIIFLALPFKNLQCYVNKEVRGEKDIAGGIKEGYKEGEVRGAISVMIFIYLQTLLR